MRSPRQARTIVGLALILGLPIGIVVGASLGLKYLQAGFPIAFAFDVKRWANLTAGGVVAYLAGFAVIRRWLTARLGFSTRAADLLANAIVSVPFVLLAGYYWNLHQNISPRGLLLRQGIIANIKLGVMLAVAWCAAAWLTRHCVEDHGRRRWFQRGSVMAALGAILILLNIGPFMYPHRATADPARPNVILIVIDTLRADHVGAYGYSRATTPNIDAFARDGVVFRQAISQGTFTKTSIASLLTSRLPHQHGVYRGVRRRESGDFRADALGSDETTVAEILKSQGFLTGAWVRNPNLGPRSGLGQGFVTYEHTLRSIEMINAGFSSWLAQAASPYRVFAYLHYLDLHSPYRPRPPYDTLFGTYASIYAQGDRDRWERHIGTGRLHGRLDSLSQVDLDQLKALYDGLIRYVDDELGRLFAELKRRGVYDNSLIIVTADHGEGFMEHGFLEHSNIPYDELVHVPLVIKLPESRFAGRTIERQVRLVDVMPTILEEVGVDVPRGLAGCSLSALVRGRDDVGADCFRYAITETADEAIPLTVAVRTQEAKYILSGRRPAEFYDLRADPAERDNIIDEANPVKEAMSRIASSVARRQKDDGSVQEIDLQTVDELKALGYVR